MKHAGSTECPRKHSRASEDAEDAAIASSGKKTRGRPRVETQDATAGDVSTNLIHPYFSASRVVRSLDYIQGAKI